MGSQARFCHVVLKCWQAEAIQRKGSRDLPVLGREKVDGPVLPSLTPLGAVHLDHLLDPETQTLCGVRK